MEKVCLSQESVSAKKAVNYALYDLIISRQTRKIKRMQELETISTNKKISFYANKKAYLSDENSLANETFEKAEKTSWIRLA